MAMGHLSFLIVCHLENVTEDKPLKVNEGISHKKQSSQQSTMLHLSVSDQPAAQ